MNEKVDFDAFKVVVDQIDARESWKLNRKGTDLELEQLEQDDDEYNDEDGKLLADKNEATKFFKTKILQLGDYLENQRDGDAVLNVSVIDDIDVLVLDALKCLVFHPDAKADFLGILAERGIVTTTFQHLFDQMKFDVDSPDYEKFRETHGGTESRNDYEGVEAIAVAEAAGLKIASLLEVSQPTGKKQKKTKKGKKEKSRE